MIGAYNFIFRGVNDGRLIATHKRSKLYKPEPILPSLCKEEVPGMGFIFLFSEVKEEKKNLFIEGMKIP
ncbi:MAG: hypothetical protein KBG92_04475 [Spirochaetes bacterium]|jgi:hypothetical protein|nr:hypothetical protein [Spirochaetota bacterium]MBP8987038.1 hypothetical protein [Spirochaetota bacterium]HOE21292.1 hypothetical protein [Spirochaetota bacterium]HQL43381.1 hypothetical protein [Spirochaetota bacterium]